MEKTEEDEDICWDKLEEQDEYDEEISNFITKAQRTVALLITYARDNCLYMLDMNPFQKLFG